MSDCKGPQKTLLQDSVPLYLTRHKAEVRSMILQGLKVEDYSLKFQSGVDR